MLVKYYFLSLRVRITPGTGSKCGYQKQKANMPLFFKQCDHKSSYYHHSPWGRFALEANNFEKAKRTNEKIMTLSRKNWQHEKNKHLLMIEVTAHSKVYNMEFELDFELCSCDLVMINNHSSPLFCNNLKSASFFPREGLCFP